jgi:hypothetical protein
MTVREKAQLSRLLKSSTKIKAIWARSKIVGELQVQVIGREGTVETVYVPSSANGQDRKINLLDFATAKQWQKSRSFLSAVSMGHLVVTLEKA